MNSQQPSRPVITPAMREQAAQQPNSWLYVVDPIFTDPNAEVPPWGFIGGFRVDEHGEITSDFSPNPNYRPSPVALRLPAPTNDVERALQLTTTGYAPSQTLLGALLEAELILFAQPQGEGLFTFEHQSGRNQLQVFTSEGHLPHNWTSWQRMSGRTLAELRPVGTDLQVNPLSPAKARVPCEDLIRAAGIPLQTHANAPRNGAEATTVLTDVGTHQRSPQPAPTPPPATPARSTAAQPPSETSPTPPPPTPAGNTTAQVADSTGELTGEAEPDEWGGRLLGSLLTAAAGDALGAPVEFYPVEQIRNRYGAAGVTDYDRDGQQQGSFTDDSQLMLFALEGFLRGHIAVRHGVAETPLPAVQLALQRWLHSQGYSWARVAGPFATTHPEPDGWLVERPELFAVRSPASSSISALREFASSGVPGTIERPLYHSGTHGAVLRGVGAALWSDDADEVFELAACAAALTHGEPDGYLPAGTFAVLLRELLHGTTPYEALAEARRVLSEHVAESATEQALAAAVNLAEHGRPTPERIKDALGGGWSGPEALSIAVCALLSTESLADAVLLAVNHSGDSDSTGAICGALAGARYGGKALPGTWLRDLRGRETIESLARDAMLEFTAEPPDDPTWRQRYPGRRDTSELPFSTGFPAVLAASAEDHAAPDEKTDSPDEPSEETGGVDQPAGTPPENGAETETPSTTGSEVSAGHDRATTGAAREPVLGCLLGGAVGDALGYAVEFESMRTIRERFGPEGITGFERTDAPARISDDTQMTLFTMEGLVRAGHSLRRGLATDPVELVQHAYQRWLYTQGFDGEQVTGPGCPEPDGWLLSQQELFNRRAPGTTCVKALHGFAAGRAPGSMDNPLNDSKGCGAVMRAAPAALWSADPAEVFRIGAETGVLTHGHPSGYLPAGTLAVLVRRLLEGDTLRQALDTAMSHLSNWDGHEETTDCLLRARELVSLGAPGPEVIEQQLGGGWVGEEALAIAVYAALSHPDSFADAVRLAANHSGDSDSTAAVCGNIMGSALSAERIPAEWLAALELREVIERLARDAELEFGTGTPPESEWQRRYPVPNRGSASATSPRWPLRAGALAEASGDHDAEEPSALPEAGEEQLEPVREGTEETSTAEAEPEAGETGRSEHHEDERRDTSLETAPDGSETPSGITAPEGSSRSATEFATAADFAATDISSFEDTDPQTDADEPVSTVAEEDRRTTERSANTGEERETGMSERREEGATTEEEDGAETTPAEEDRGETPSPTVPPTRGTDGAPEESEDADDALPEEDLSEEETRLLTAWRKLRDSPEEVPAELAGELRELTVRAFGAERAALLFGERSEETAGSEVLVRETPLRLEFDERLAGCVLGAACGDAFAAPWILGRADRLERAESIELAEAFGGRGRGTAITQQLAFVLAGTIRAEVLERRHAAETTHVASVHEALRHWLSTQGVAVEPPATTDWLSRCSELNAQRFPDHAGTAALAEAHTRESVPSPSDPPNDDAGFLATARAAPLGLFAPDVGTAFTLGAETAALTHGSPDGYLPAGALAALSNALLRGEPLADAVGTVLAELDKYAGAENTGEALRSAVRLARRGTPTPETLRSLGTGWYGPGALGIGVLAALSYPDSWRRAVVLAAGHAGNSAATAAICGAVLGVSRGSGALPAKWLDRLEVREILDRLLADRRNVPAITPEGKLPSWARAYVADDERS
ncbi:ADP-ribosylglycohydrolase [Actinopolyspora xinjiangensis]|uniref:ADP-ribosylglycohydrolase n=1 Tax=Actinopolyspora xinjiangensis TaxID=405564 RepID=A0A1H0UBA3_9ACTN|nr:type VII secretion system-associated protein [Actinopolyspora xinjiangensis]SDP63278.1 ADP-ribosylglycohydrolase [Actinopolyspora xinjiangensis]